MAWHRRLVARKFDGSKKRTYPGRPPVDRDLEDLIVRLATENRDWGYDRIAGALANLGHEVSDQTVGNILKRHDIPTAPERKKTTTWTEFIRYGLPLFLQCEGEEGVAGLDRHELRAVEGKADRTGVDGCPHGDVPEFLAGARVQRVEKTVFAPAEQ